MTREKTAGFCLRGGGAVHTFPYITIQVEHTTDAPATPSTAAQCVEAMHTMDVHCNSTPVTGIVRAPPLPPHLALTAPLSPLALSVGARTAGDGVQDRPPQVEYLLWGADGQVRAGQVRVMTSQQWRALVSLRGGLFFFFF